MEEKLPSLFGRLPKAKYGFREIETFRAESAPDAYYYRPPEDGSRPAYFYVNTFRPETRPKYTMEGVRSEEHTSELQSRQYLVCRLLLEKKTTSTPTSTTSRRMPCSHTPPT